MKSGLENLKLDHWSKIVTVFAAAVLVISLTVEIKGVPNSEVTLFSLGAALIGIGEIINHPWQEVIVPPSAIYPGWMKGEGYQRNTSFMGVLFILSGVVLIGYRLYCIFKQTYSHYAQHWKKHPE